MKNLFLSTALAGMMLVSPALAAPIMISTIDVTLDLEAVTNKAAALRYTKITDDLKNAILAVLVDRIAEDGSKMSIDLSEVELSNSFTETAGTADTRLSGDIMVTNTEDNSKTRTFTLQIDVNQAMTYFPADVDKTQLMATSDDYYKAMIQAFAQNTLIELDK